ncbi:MAG: hypothetical protein AAFY20_13360 [Cyanobacteria bacterium J06639_14]
MNAVSQAITPDLTIKIANLAVLFRAEFPDVQIDLSPWLTDAKTQDQLNPYSIDLSFFLPEHGDILACQCVLMQVHFSDDLLQPTCRLSTIQVDGYNCTQRQWQFSTEDWTFAGVSVPDNDHQKRFKYLINRILELFQYPNQVNIYG